MSQHGLGRETVSGRATGITNCDRGRVGRAVPPYDVVVQSITIAPGGHTGWHTHPGIAVAALVAADVHVPVSGIHVGLAGTYSSPEHDLSSPS